MKCNLCKTPMETFVYSVLIHAHAPYYYNLIARNGKIVLSSDFFTTLHSCDHAALAIARQLRVPNDRIVWKGK